MEILTGKQSSQAVLNQQIRDASVRPVQTWSPLPPGNPLSTTLTQSAVYNLLPGTYPAPTLTVPTTVNGMQSILPGMSIDTQATVKGCRFTDTVTLSSNARVVFDTCTFEAPVNTQPGGRATFNGCIFRGGYVNNSLGLPADVGIVGCFRTTGIPHINVTIIWEQTL